MKTTAIVTTIIGITIVLASHPRPSAAAVYAAQLYPYCQISSSNGGMNCYITSKTQCEFREICIDNPWYLGNDAARAWKQKNAPRWRWW